MSILKKPKKAMKKAADSFDVFSTLAKSEKAIIKELKSMKKTLRRLNYIISSISIIQACFIISIPFLILAFRDYILKMLGSN